MKNNFWNKRIPTILGLLIITSAIAVTTFLVGSPTFFTGRASPSTSPTDVRITNVSDNSFSVTYTTAGSVLGSINFGKDQDFGQTIIDNKDKDKVKEHKIHSFTIQNLSPSTKYLFSITSGQESFLNNGVPYEVTTAPEIPGKKGAGFIVGKVLTPQGQIPAEGVVFATTTGAETLSTDIKPDGTYTISLESIRSEDLTTLLNLKNEDLVKLLVVTDSGESNVILLGKNINSVPIVVVGQNYDFSKEGGIATSSASFGKFPTVSVGKSQGGPKIISPSENQNVATTKPLFSGTASPSSKVQITINSSQTIQTQVTTDSNGNWSYQSSTSLSPGQHTITITAPDSLGILRTITQTFTIAPIAQAASPTSTPTPTPTPSLIPTPTPNSTPISSASAFPTPTAIPTLIPTIRPTPIPTLLPTGDSQVQTGFLGVAVFVAGALFLLISKIVL